jgi:hypothetical protein
VFMAAQNLHKLKVLLLVYTDVSEHHLDFFHKSRSSVGALYKLNIFNVDDLVSSSK